MAFDGDKWKLIDWSYKRIDPENPKIRKEKIKSSNISNSDVSELISFMDAKGFFSFNQDSLNWNRKDQGNGKILVQSISDGTIDTFEIISTLGHRISYAHEAEKRQSFVFNNQRQNFVECRNQFLKFVNKRGQ